MRSWQNHNRHPYERLFRLAVCSATLMAADPSGAQLGGPSRRPIVVIVDEKGHAKEVSVDDLPFPKILSKKEQESLITASNLLNENSLAQAITLLEPLYKRAPNEQLVYYPPKSENLPKSEFLLLNPRTLLICAYRRAGRWLELYSLLKHHLAIMPLEFLDISDIILAQFGEAREKVMLENPSAVTPIFVAQHPICLADAPCAEIQGGQIFVAVEMAVRALQIQMKRQPHRLVLFNDRTTLRLSVRAKGVRGRKMDAILIGERCLVPMRPVAQFFGYDVKWHPERREAELVSPP